MKLSGFNLNTYLNDLKYLVNQDSCSDDPEGVGKIADFFKEKYEELGCLTKIYNFNEKIGPCLKVQTGNKDYYDILLIGHMDTVFQKGTAAKRPFYIKDNFAYGPGVSDMKAGLLSAYYLLKSMKKANLFNKFSVCVLLNSDEEIGSIHSEDRIKEHAKKSKKAFVLEPGRPGGAFVIERKGTAKYEIDFKGVATHAGIAPEKGKSAIVEMANWIVKLDKLNDYNGGTTLNTGIVTGGTAANVVADRAYMKLDVRFKNFKGAEKIHNTIMQMPENTSIEGVKANVKKISFREPMVPNEKTLELFEKLKRIGKKAGNEINKVTVGGVSDGNGISTLGIPVIDGFGPVGNYLHSERENLEIDSIEPRLKLLWDLIVKKP